MQHADVGFAACHDRLSPFQAGKVGLDGFLLFPDSFALLDNLQSPNVIVLAPLSGRRLVLIEGFLKLMPSILFTTESVLQQRDFLVALRQLLLSLIYGTAQIHCFGELLFDLYFEFFHFSFH